MDEGVEPLESTMAVEEERKRMVFHRLSTVDNEAPASHAQSRIWHDERIRFQSDKSLVAIHNMPFLYRLHPQHTLSTTQLRHALYLIIMKHLSLRTALVFDADSDRLMQRIIASKDANKQLFTFTESTFDTDEQLTHIMHNEKRDPHLFDLAQGLVFRCHLLYYKQSSSNDLLCDQDAIVFNFHQAVFDVPSIDVFLHDLHQAYTTGQLTNNADTTLRYLDYTVIEQQMPMTAASMFWLDALHDCHLDRSLPLPYDRYRVSDEHRTGRGTSISFDLGQDLSHLFLAYASAHDITVEQLALACYYAFLFKLCNGESDLCVGMNTHGRYKKELAAVIGMFVNAIPLRCQLDPHWSFHKLVEHVQDVMTKSVEYSYYPLQRILAQHSAVSKPTFLHTSFEFKSIDSGNTDDKIVIGGCRLHAMPLSIKISDEEIMSTFDFVLSIEYDRNINRLSCAINASLDLFNVETINKISQRFYSMSKQLFVSDDVHTKKSIYELSLILSDERSLMQSINNTQVLFPPVTCIHHDFVGRVMKHPQKLAVELDDQSLTYAELLHCVQQVSLHLLNERKVVVGEIVCQCVERSVSMVIGMLAIETVGGVYCPLSPRDPQHRLQALTQQTQSSLILVHWRTKTKNINNIVLFDINLVVNHDTMDESINIDRLSNIVVTPENIAYVIFTSGSTGTPKAVQIRHRNFSEYMHSSTSIEIINDKDTVVQMARCSFDMHIQQIIGTLTIGGTVVMLHPEGTLDMTYLATVLQLKQVTFMDSVPSLFQSFFTFVEKYNNQHAVKYLRSLQSAGEAFPVKLNNLLRKSALETCQIWNSYGPAEATIVSTSHHVNITIDTEHVPMGLPLSNYQCLIKDHFLQSVIVNQEGELFVGGGGVFAGYLGRDDLTKEALVEVDGEMFYRTGDLVRMDNNGFLYYVGRQDYQIKLHGQRIELGEIERCLLNTSISACIVMKGSDDHLVAYVQSSDIDETALREHCQSRLPPHMIPSKFVVLKQLPVNANGKIDRKLLPSPDISSSTLLSTAEPGVFDNQLEKIVHDVWCEVLKCDGRQISPNTSFFSVGGHSRLFIELYLRYRTLFDFDTRMLSVAPFLQQPTVAEHAKLLERSTTDDTQVKHWHTLHLSQSTASFAQERIFSDEQFRFSNKVAIYNELVVLRVAQGALSTDRLLQAVRFVLNKHDVLRTALVYDDDNNAVQQCITNNDQTFSFANQQTFENDDELQHLIYQTTTDHGLFDLSSGRIFHVQALRQRKMTHEIDDIGFLEESDVLAVHFHHAAVDRTSIQILLNDLYRAYNDNMTPSVDEESFKYIDYSVHERLMDMTASRDFWHSRLLEYNFQHVLLLPVDRHRSSTDHRSNLASAAVVSFDDELLTTFLSYASSRQVTPFQLGLTVFYAFLFKLTHGETDLCIASLNANRYRNESQNMMGMFVAILPTRIQLNSRWTFDELVEHVREMCVSSLEHSHYPLQNILADFRQKQSSVPFLETLFDFITVSSNDGQCFLDGARLEQVSIKHSYEVAKFDFSLTFNYDPTSDGDQLSCSFVCSRDTFDTTTVEQIAQRFQFLFEQLFRTNSADTDMDSIMTTISQFSIILPEEAEEIQTARFVRLDHIVNEGIRAYCTALSMTPGECKVQKILKHAMNNLTSVSLIDVTI